MEFPIFMHIYILFVFKSYRSCFCRIFSFSQKTNFNFFKKIENSYVQEKWWKNCFLSLILQELMFLIESLISFPSKFNTFIYRHFVNNHKEIIARNIALHFPTQGRFSKANFSPARWVIHNKVSFRSWKMMFYKMCYLGLPWEIL